MIYYFSISADPKTPAYRTAKKRVDIPPGIITAVAIIIPHGHMGLAHFYVKKGLTQIWPRNEGHDYHGDGVTISFPEYLDIRYPPFQLRLYAWNEDTEYPHEFIIALSIIEAAKVRITRAGLPAPGK